MKKHFRFIIGILVLICGCQRNPIHDEFHPFQSQTWQRFQIIRFQIPVEKSSTSRDLQIYVRFTRDFPYRSLPFHMILRLPSGEERIREYDLPVTFHPGKADENCPQGICEAAFFLKKNLRFTKNGNLEIDLENLIPKIETPGLEGVGIRILKSER